MEPEVIERLQNIVAYTGSSGVPSFGNDLQQLINAYRRTSQPTVAADGGPRHSDPVLVIQAVRNAGLNADVKADRWVFVMQAFGIGSTHAQELCRRANLDPYERIGNDPDLSDDEEQPANVVEVPNSNWCPTCGCRPNTLAAVLGCSNRSFHRVAIKGDDDE